MLYPSNIKIRPTKKVITAIITMNRNNFLDKISFSFIQFSLFAKEIKKKTYLIIFL